jgi:Amidohydrolase family
VMLNFLVKPGDDTRTLVRFYLVGDNAADIDLASDSAKAFFQLLLARGTVIDTTIAIFEPVLTQLQGAPNPAYRKIASHVPPALQRAWLANSMDVNAQNVTRFRASYAKLLELTRRMHAAGIPFVAGTDNIAGFTLHRELEVYVEAGISPAEALQIATRNGAKYTQLSDLVGSVTVGKIADLILVDRDPTQDISAVRDISLVMKEGVTYYPSEIYEALGVKSFRPPPKVTVRTGAGASAN